MEEQMEKDLMKLLDAQKVDVEIDQLNRNTKEYPKEKARLEKEISDFENTIETMKKDITDNEVKRKTIEVEIEAERENLTKKEPRLLTTKTNKEYTAVQHEIEISKEKIDSLETEDLELMTAVDAMKPQLDELEKSLAETSEKNTKIISDIDTKYESIESDTKQLEMKRNQILEDVADRPRTIYNRLRKGKSGIAVSTVDHVKHSCRGCFKQLPPQKVLEVRRQNKLIFCENCGRILIWDTKDE